MIEKGRLRARLVLIKPRSPWRAHPATSRPPARAAHPKPVIGALRRNGRRAKAAGALFGPVTGVTLSLVALQLAPVGVASTLMALSPVLLLPLLRLVFKEPIRPRAVAGTLLAMAGVAILFLV